MNIVQKIDTGGTSRISTPMLKFLMNELFAPKDARHITHCAKVESAESSTHIAAITARDKVRVAREFIIFCRPLKESVGKSAVRHEMFIDRSALLISALPT